MPSKVWLLAKMINIDSKTVFRPQVTDMIKKIGHFYPHIFTYLFNKYLLSSFRVLHIILGTTYVTVNKTDRILHIFLGSCSLYSLRITFLNTLPFSLLLPCLNLEFKLQVSGIHRFYFLLWFWPWVTYLCFSFSSCFQKVLGNIFKTCWASQRWYYLKKNNSMAIWNKQTFWVYMTESQGISIVLQRIAYVD